MIRFTSVKMQCALVWIKLRILLKRFYQYKPDLGDFQEICFFSSVTICPMTDQEVSHFAG